MYDLNRLSILSDMFIYTENTMCKYAVTIKFMNVNFSMYRYIMIPANRGKDSKERGMALKGTGGSGKLGNQEKNQNHHALGTVMLKRIGTWGWFVWTVLLNNIDMNEPHKDSTQEIMIR